METRRDYLASFAAALARLLRASAVVVQGLEEKGFRTQALYADKSLQVEPRAWIPAATVLEQILRSGQAEQTDVLVAGIHLCRVVLPFASNEETALCITAYLEPGSPVEVGERLAMARLAALAIARRDAVSQLEEGEAVFRQATLLVELVSRTAQADSLNRSLQLLAVELENFFGCLRVAIGTGSPRFCHVHAISGIDHGEKRSLGHSQIASGMREAIALGESTVWPLQADLSREVSVSANQDDLLHAYRAGRILVMPLELPEMRFRGAIALLWPQDAPEIPSRTLRLLFACRPHLSGLVAFLHRTKPRNFRAKIQKQWRSSATKRAVAVSLGVLLLVILLFPITYRVPASCEVEPLLRRTIAAPFESRLETSHVKPGDRVAKDQVLAELDGREIRVALAEAIAERNAALKKRDNAMVLADPSSLQMAQIEADRLALEVERLQFRNDNLLVRSPLDGVVLAGDLERSEGVPVSVGQKLFEIAPLEGMILELAIPDRNIGHVEPGMEVTFRLESDGGRKRETLLKSLHPAAEVADGEHVFIAEASLENEDEFLRPGMKGEAKILARRKPVGWILFHNLWEFIRLRLW